MDADACPNVIKEILYRAAERTGVNVTLVANQPLTTPRIPSLRSVQVASGFDVADNEIVKRVTPGDLVVTADIPLAAEVIAKGCDAVNPPGRALFSRYDSWNTRHARFYGHNASQRQ